VIDRLKIADTEVPELLARHFNALRRPGSPRRRNLIPLLNVLSTEDGTIEIEIVTT
jgi:hypothetical protein